MSTNILTQNDIRHVDYKDVDLLKQFINPHGRIISRTRTRLTARQQRAVEAAIKLAKFASKKPGIIAFQGGFHGRTLGALSVTTSKMKYREGYEPLLPEVYIAPFDLLLVEGLLKENESVEANSLLQEVLKMLNSMTSRR